MLRRLALIPLLFASAAQAEEAKDAYADTLFGHWGGARDALADKGVDVSLQYTGDIVHNADGGIRRGTNYLDDWDLKFALDGEKLFGIPNNKSLLYVISNTGGRPNQRLIGSFSGVDSLEIPRNGVRLYEAWTDQGFLDNTLFVLVGLRDINDEFMWMDISGYFLKPTFQLSQTLNQTGRNSPSTFPYTAPGMRVKFTPTAESYVEAAAVGAIAGDPNHLNGTHITWGGGQLLLAEAGITPNVPEGADMLRNKFAIGGWMYTKKFADQLLPGVTARSEGAYLLSSYQVYTQGEQRVTAFFRPAVDDGDTKPVRWSYEVGMVADGFVPVRPNGEIGIGFSQGRNAHKYIQAQRDAGVDVPQNELGVELYYRDHVYPGIYLQPDIQWLANPSAVATAKNATVVAMRAYVGF